MTFWKETPDGILLKVRVVPRSSRSGIVGEHDGALKIKLNAPPVDGAANAELINLLAETFATSKSDITITSGANSKSKQIYIRHCNLDSLEGFAGKAK